MAAKKTVKSPKPTKKTTSTAEAKPIFIDNLDHKIRPAHSGKNSACPACGAFPTVTKIRRTGYELRRCRECGHIFEVNK